MLTTQPNIDKAWIEAHIPHQGGMCLLEHVTNWNEQSISCSATSHQLTNNPLRYREQLSTACGVEYAAQAMAVHGALLTSTDQKNPRAGFLLSIRGTTVHHPRLDNIKQALTIEATRIHSSESSILYTFTLYATDDLLLEGRAAVMLNTESLLRAPT
ncbi:MAG: 3-hydroxylacyl-ACP dehydratase [Methylophilaceae bacterium]